MRDIGLAIIILGSLPICFRRPWIGILMWSWLAYMNPHRLTWGFAWGQPWAQMVAVVTIGGILFSRGGDWRPLPWTRELFFLFGFWLIIIVSTIFSEYPYGYNGAWSMLEKVSKILLFTVITIGLMQDRNKVRWLVVVITLSLGFYGLKGGIWAVMTGGGERVLGPERSFIAGNTEIGLALNMILPFILGLRRDESNKWFRHFLLVMFCFTIIAILITHSRGALLGLVAVLGMIFLKSKAKIIMFVVLALSVPIAMTSLPSHWFSRMESIEAKPKDRSAAGRLESWKLAYRMALDRPLVGFGFRPFSPEMYAKYLPEHPVTGWDAHSIYFQVLAEHGFTGLILYVGIIILSILSVRKLNRLCRGDPNREWIANYAQMIEASLVAYMVCGAFLSRSYFDLFYHVVAVTIILKKLYQTEVINEYKSRKANKIRESNGNRLTEQRVLAPVSLN